VTGGQTERRADGLGFAVDGGVATVTLGRPERRNAMTPEVWHGLAEIGSSLPPQVRVVVVRGEGPSFCAGIDLSLLAGSGGEPIPGPDDQDLDQKIAGYQAGYLWLRAPQIVSIAAVQGHAIGAGFQLALACDMRILTEDAKLCMKEPALGLVPDLTGTKPLVDIVGLPRAIELCLTARTVNAAEALLLRLAELVVPVDELEAAVADLVAALLATDAAAARATKGLLQHASGHSLAEQAAEERRVQAELLRGRT
jgi:enoyl-CoA hydratase/carnithine racemase